RRDVADDPLVNERIKSRHQTAVQERIDYFPIGCVPTDQQNSFGRTRLGRSSGHAELSADRGPAVKIFERLLSADAAGAKGLTRAHPHRERRAQPCWVP